jgi:UDP-galactopyranose mutase
MKRFLVVGAGMFGSVCARELTDAGHRVTVIEKRDHVGGNCFTRYVPEADCHEHVYGAHIFHTSDERIWTYVNRFARFNRYVNRVKVNWRGELYSFPINLFTLYQLWGVRTPDEARRKLESVREPIASPSNLEEWCLSQVGREIYGRFVRGYTMKQWRRDPRELPASLIRRLPIRLTFDDDYFDDRYQGIPIGGYTAMFERLLDGIEVHTGVDFLADREGWMAGHDRVIYTGALDAFFDYRLGSLEYRSLRFERELLDTPDFQGNAVINYTDEAVPWTRILEHKHFNPGSGTACTLVTREYPADWAQGGIEFYPVNTPDNDARFRKYRTLADEWSDQVSFGGRLAEYRYYDMHQVIGSALAHVRKLLSTGTGSAPSIHLESAARRSDLRQHYRRFGPRVGPTTDVN